MMVSLRKFAFLVALVAFASFPAGATYVPLPNPLPVISPLPSTDNPINVKISVTGTAVQLPSTVLLNGLSCVAVIFSGNPIFIGGSGVSNQTAANWTSSNGEMLQVNGQGWARAISNANVKYINGTAGDGVTCGGN